MADQPGIIILRDQIESEELVRLVALFFGDMVKFVVDVDLGIAAVGGELHADAESQMLDAGSEQRNLWGANYYPGRGEENCLEYTALINIRPADGNRSMEIQDPQIRQRVREIAFALIGRGEPLP